MSEEEAKTIIRTPGYPNVAKTIEALFKAVEVLGDDATMTEIHRWASSPNEKE